MKKINSEYVRESISSAGDLQTNAALNKRDMLKILVLVEIRESIDELTKEIHSTNKALL